MKKRFNILPTYHFEENTDGQIRGAAERVLRDCTIYGNCGKNLLPYPFRYHNIYGVKNGITVTDSGNSSITLNGTAAANTVVYIETSGRYPLAAGKYFLSGKPSDITGFRLTAGAVGNDGSTLRGATDDGAGAVFDISGIANKDDYQGITIAIRINEGTVFDNFVLKPQLELGEAATDFEPYTAPKTTNLLLDAPLGPGESISCREKGLLLPELATIDPRITNYITFGSEVKPSSANFDYYKY